MARKNNGEPKTFAYEEFMARARKEGRVRNEELSMKVLKPDLSLQARVNHIDVDHVRALHDILKNGQPLAPIIVFEIDGPKGKTFKIADGFHRHEVYKREGLPGIPCIVVSGTLQEAIEYAASANQALSLPRTREDTKKAVFLLFDNGWLSRSDKWVSEQVGCSTSAVRSWKLDYVQATGCDEPEYSMNRNGVTVRRGGNRGMKYKRKDGLATIKINGRPIYGEDKVEAAIAAREVEVKRLSDSGKLRCALAGRGVHMVATKDGFTAYQPWYRAGGLAFTMCPSNRENYGRHARSLVTAAADAHMARIYFGLGKAVVIVPFAINDGAYADATEFVGRLNVEIMTFDEFVAAVKADDGNSEPSAVTA